MFNFYQCIFFVLQTIDSESILGSYRKINIEIKITVVKK